jgi:hypothetical protein
MYRSFNQQVLWRINILTSPYGAITRDSVRDTSALKDSSSRGESSQEIAYCSWGVSTRLVNHPQICRKVYSMRNTPSIHIDIETYSPWWSALRKHLLTLMGQEVESHYFKITREAIRKHMNQHFPVAMVLKVPIVISQEFLTFIEFPTFIDFEGFIDLCERFNRWTREDFISLYFHLIDFDGDGMISSSDLFKFYKMPKLDKDF